MYLVIVTHARKRESTLLNIYTHFPPALPQCGIRVRDGGRGKSKSKSTKCYFSTVLGGIGTVDGAARGCDALPMHGLRHASGRRLSSKSFRLSV